MDVEDARAHEVPLDLVDRLLAPDEAAALGAVSPSRRRARVLEYWTFKESCIQARGMGLSLPIQPDGSFGLRRNHVVVLRAERLSAVSPHVIVR